MTSGSAAVIVRSLRLTYWIRKCSPRCLLRPGLCIHRIHNTGKYMPIKMCFKNIPTKRGVKIVHEKGGRQVSTERTLPRTYLSSVLPIHLVGERRPEHSCTDSEIQPSVDLLWPSCFLYPHDLKQFQKSWGTRLSFFLNTLYRIILSRRYWAWPKLNGITKEDVPDCRLTEILVWGEIARNNTQRRNTSRRERTWERVLCSSLQDCRSMTILYIEV